MKSLFVALLLPVAGFAAEHCHPLPRTNDGVLVGWITDVRQSYQQDGLVRHEPFRPLALLKDGRISATSGADIEPRQKFWLATTPAEEPVQLASVVGNWETQGRDHCVYSATLAGPALPRFTLLTSAPLAGEFRTPTQAEKERFAQKNTRCIVQGDPPSGTPCTRAVLLAVTDVNRDKRPEYWAAEPYLWDTGLTVWEDAPTLLPLLQLCEGCSAEREHPGHSGTLAMLGM